MTIFDQMMARYDVKSESQKRNAAFEVMQEIALAGLYRGGFFNKAAFYGGTCLRIFYGMDRFSEDLDFSLIAPENNFHLEDYFPAIITEFSATGKDVIISKKEKRTFGSVESAFLKDNTELYDLSFRTEKSVYPFSFMTRCFVLSDLFAGKMHAFVFRGWKNRVKGRDWYDFEWYVRKGVELNFGHLQARIREFNGIEMNKEQFLKSLKERIATTDVDTVKSDVIRFIKNRNELDIWSNDYFLMLADRLKFR